MNNLFYLKCHTVIVVKYLIVKIVTLHLFYVCTVKTKFT